MKFLAEIKNQVLNIFDAQGERTDLTSGGSRQKLKALKDAGIQPRRANEYEKIANIPEDEFEHILQEAQKQTRKVTSNMLSNMAKAIDRFKKIV